MVKIIEKNFSQIEIEQKANKFINIAREVLPDYFFRSSLFPESFAVFLNFDVGSPAFYVKSRENRIRVNDKGMFEPAVRLAGEYEASGEDEFSVEKHYIE